MSEYQRPTIEAELAQNFEQLHPLMDDTMAHYASAKCLYCYDAPCISACPTGIDIPLFIRQIRTQNIDGAAKTIYDSNYFGQICGKVCPTEVLCEGACVYNDQDQLPVEIGSLQTYACNHAIQKNAQLFDLAPDNGKKVAVIGAGPSGIACACELRMHGYTVDVFEAKAMPSGLALHGTAPYKITNGEVLEEVAFLEEQFKFNLFLNQAIDTTEKLQKLESNYDAIFLGIGLGETTRLGISGEDLTGCMGAIEFIEKVKLNPLDAYPGNRVVVIGGGNTAMDAASESARLGATEVTLAYRRSRVEMSAYDFEYDLVKSAGVNSVFHVSPVEIRGTDRVESVTFVRMTNTNGELTEIPDSQFSISCDAVILATGQSKFVELLQQISGIELNKSGAIITNSAGQTGNPKYFSGGDAMNGAAEVVNAAAEGKSAARGIHDQLIMNNE
jgi:glutamate synthase (NADPH/NADH) small chain